MSKKQIKTLIALVVSGGLLSACGHSHSLDSRGTIIFVCDKATGNVITAIAGPAYFQLDAEGNKIQVESPDLENSIVMTDYSHDHEDGDVDHKHDVIDNPRDIQSQCKTISLLAKQANGSSDDSNNNGGGQAEE